MAAGEIGVGLRFGGIGDGAFDPNLTGQRLPVEQQRGMHVDREIARFAALLVGIENEAAIIGAFQQQDARRGPSLGVHRHHRHRIGIGRFAGFGVRHPLGELDEGIGRDACCVGHCDDHFA